MRDVQLFAVDTADDGSLRVSGEIDLSRASQLRGHLDAAIDAMIGDVVVDLSAVTFIDSTGFHALADADARLEAVGRRLRIVSPSPYVVRVLELSGVFDHFVSLQTGVEPAPD